jgi:muramoyltetrapeptide carboxypeptidase
MKKPPYLQEGDKVGLVSPARKITSIEIKSAIKMFQRWGLEPVFGRHIFSSYHQFAGSDMERALDFQEFLDNPNIKAIISTRGGYGSVRIIDELDFTSFIRQPKWLVGFSDFTVFHSHIHTNCQISTIHAAMPINFPTDQSENESVVSLKSALFGELKGYVNQHCKIFRSGQAVAPIVGGNLSILYSLTGTKSDINTNYKILFLEDVDEYLYHIDRMMWNFKRTGKLARLKGLIVGGMNKMHDNTVPFGGTAEDIIWDAVKDYSYPVVMNFPAGHIDSNNALFLGRTSDLRVDKNSLELSFL